MWWLTHQRHGGCQLALPLSSHFGVQVPEALHDVSVAHKSVPHGARLACTPVKGSILGSGTRTFFFFLKLLKHKVSCIFKCMLYAATVSALEIEP